MKAQYGRVFCPHCGKVYFVVIATMDTGRTVPATCPNCHKSVNVTRISNTRIRVEEVK